MKETGKHFRNEWRNEGKNEKSKTDRIKIFRNEENHRIGKE